MSWKILYSKQSLKDAKRLRQAKLWDRAEKLLRTIRENPFLPPYEKLKKDFKGMYAKRIHIQHRLVYEVFEDRNTVRIFRMWSHYE